MKSTELFQFDEADGSIFETIDGKKEMLFAPHPDCEFDEYDDYVLKAEMTCKAVNAHEDAIELAQLARDFMLAIEGIDTLTENEKQVLDAAQKFLAKAKGE